MDFFSHILWTYLLYRTLGPAAGSPVLAAFFGVVPDIAFVLAILFIAGPFAFRLRNIRHFRPPKDPRFQRVRLVYRWSHSMVSMAAFFLVSSLWLGAPYWPAFGWALHIILDLWTHRGSPVEPQMPFYPLSKFGVRGVIWWRNPYFLVVNWALLALAYFGLR